jgi:hypothetical protein
MGAVHVASIGQADDVALVSNDLHKLQGLLHLAMEYSTDSHTEMVPEKNKGSVFYPTRPVSRHLLLAGRVLRHHVRPSHLFL